MAGFEPFPCATDERSFATQNGGVLDDHFEGLPLDCGGTGLCMRCGKCLMVVLLLVDAGVHAYMLLVSVLYLVLVSDLVIYALFKSF